MKVATQCVLHCVAFCFKIYKRGEALWVRIRSFAGIAARNFRLNRHFVRTV